MVFGMSSKSRSADKLRDAANSRTLVRIRRSPRNADRIDGFVIGVDSRWALIAQTGDGGFFDGLVALRVADVVHVENDASFEGRFAQTQPEWPPTAPPNLDLETTAGLVAGMSAISRLIGIEQERRFHTRMVWIGVIDEVTKGWLSLHEVRPDATWLKRPLGYKLRHITKVRVLDRYLTALATMAG
jgi:hypothetical protein